MNNAKHLAAFIMAFAIGANAVLITNGDWETTLNGNWDSKLAEDAQTDLKGWFSSLKAAGNLDGACINALFLGRRLWSNDHQRGNATNDHQRDNGYPFHTMYSSRRAGCHLGDHLMVSAAPLITRF